MTIKYIHVNQHKIRSNKKNNENEPVLTVKEGKKNTYGQVSSPNPRSWPRQEAQRPKPRESH